MPFDPAKFRSVVGRFASGVTILTACDEAGTDHGMTVSAFCSLSLEPPLVLVCVERIAEMHDVLASASQFAINILASGQESISRRFAERMEDRFDGIGFARGVSGAALLHGTLAHAECSVKQKLNGGDHSIFIGEVIDAETRDDRPLLYYRGGYAQLER